MESRMNYNSSADELNSVANSAADAIRGAASSIKQELGRAGRLAKDASEEQLEELGKIGTEQVERAADFVREHPLATLLLGGAIGYLACLLQKR